MRDLEILAGGVTVWQVPPKGKILQCYLYLKRSSSVDHHEAKKPPPPPRRLFGGAANVPAPPPTPKAERSQSEKAVRLFLLRFDSNVMVRWSTRLCWNPNGKNSTWSSSSKPQSNSVKSTTSSSLARVWSTARGWACRCGKTRRKWTWSARRWRTLSAGVVCSLCCGRARACGPRSAAVRGRWDLGVNTVESYRFVFYAGGARVFRHQRDRDGRPVAVEGRLRAMNEQWILLFWRPSLRPLSHMSRLSGSLLTLLTLHEKNERAQKTGVWCCVFVSVYMCFGFVCFFSFSLFFV